MTRKWSASSLGLCTLQDSQKSLVETIHRTRLAYHARTRRKLLKEMVNVKDSISFPAILRIVAHLTAVFPCGCDSQSSTSSDGLR